ncbi:MAG TPA: hypothetical protein VD737_03040 [Steroidobacteraceae bacterium]|nr:hypothetical protein [Steroidobacteraceae bacterium]
MHARVEHLLSLRDGHPVDVAVRAHVQRCARCAAALADATELPARLRALPPAAADQRGWRGVRERLASRRRADAVRARLGRVAAVASIAVIAVAVAWRVAESPGLHSPDPTVRIATPLSAEEAVALDRVLQLRSQSAALEDALAVIGDRPAVQRAGTTLPIDTIEAQVQWIDHRLSAGAGDDAIEAERLWRERVDAMNTLVRLRYVELQPVAM